MSETKNLDVFTIVENPKGEKDFWVRIGVGFINKDGSVNVTLNALPVNGKLHLREKTEKPQV